MLRIGIISSNAFRIAKTTKKGTEIFLHTFLSGLAIQTDLLKDISITVFASGDSIVPFPLVSISKTATWGNPEYDMDDHKFLEMALISKAFSMQDQFDLFHVHISNGEYFLPFAGLTNKPILITRHGTAVNEIRQDYFKLFAHQQNIHFVAISRSQQQLMPFLPYAATIHHGINLANFPFDAQGGEKIVWAGRAVPEKGLDKVIEVAAATYHQAKIFPILKPEHLNWFLQDVLDKRDELNSEIEMEMNIHLNRHLLVRHYQTSKLLLFPITWEEPFGLVMIEAMATGTPVVAFARGSTPEVIVDGVTGFLVNPSPEEIRGSYTVRETGIAGLIEAVERIYSLSAEDYRKMRQHCRDHMEKNFNIRKMVLKYIETYKDISAPTRS